MNQIHIKGDLNDVTVEADRFAANVTKDYCLVNLEHYTFKIDRKYYRALEVALEMGLSMEGEE